MEYLDAAESNLLSTYVGITSELPLHIHNLSIGSMEAAEFSEWMRRMNGFPLTVYIQMNNSFLNCFDGLLQTHPTLSFVKVEFPEYDVVSLEVTSSNQAQDIFPLLQFFAQMDESVLLSLQKNIISLGAKPIKIGWFYQVPFSVTFHPESTVFFFTDAGGSLEITSTSTDFQDSQKIASTLPPSYLKRLLIDQDT